MNLPNKLTLIRIFLIPVFTLLLAFNWPAGYLTIAGTKVAMSWFIALIIFIVASLTDFADGQIARRKHLVTNFGKFADPLADKLLSYDCIFVPDSSWTDSGMGNGDYPMA